MNCSDVKILAAVALLTLASGGAVADTYSRTIPVGPMRVSVDQMQAPLDKASALAHAAIRETLKSEGDRPRTISEEIELHSGERTFTIPGHTLRSSARPLAEHIDELNYRFRLDGYSPTGDHPPITAVTISLRDYSRWVEVTGEDQQQVDGLASAVTDDFRGLQSSIGGAEWEGLAPALIIVSFLGALICGLFGVFGEPAPHRRVSWGIFAIFLVILILSCIVLSTGLITGFAMFDQNPEWYVRFGPELGLVFGVLSIIGIILPLLDRFRKTPSPIPVPAALQGPTPPHDTPSGAPPSPAVRRGARRRVGTC